MCTGGLQAKLRGVRTVVGSSENRFFFFWLAFEKRHPFIFLLLRLCPASEIQPDILGSITRLHQRRRPLNPMYNVFSS